MRRNIEVKARLDDLTMARTIAERLSSEPVLHEHQIDTYFECPNGRLKLREINGTSATLIWYQRPNQCAAKGSDYLLVPVNDAATLKQALDGAWGTRLLVEKQREIYFYRNVRIHLDQVKGLGAFFELEAVLGTDCDDEEGHRWVAFLLGEFGIDASRLLEGSYVDLLPLA